MKKCLMPWLLLMTIIFSCKPNAQEEDDAVINDSSLIVVADSSDAGVTDSTAAVADTLEVHAGQLIGKWMQPVPGLDKEMQGFILAKNGKARSVNMYTLVYEKWQLSHDTLLLWNHSEGVKDTTTVIDTTIIKELSDTSLVLFPVKAAEGYRERYSRAGKKVTP